MIKLNVGKPVDATNFRADVNANGTISAADVGLGKYFVGTSINVAAAAQIVAATIAPPPVASSATVAQSSADASSTAASVLVATSKQRHRVGAHHSVLAA